MSVVEFFSQPVWHRLGLTLVHFLWQGLAVAAIAFAAVRLLGLRRGNPRYTVYLLALAVMAVCPLVTFTALAVPAAPAALAPGPMPEIESSPRSAAPEPPQRLSEDTVTAIPTHRASLRERLDGVLQASLPWALVCWMGGVLVLSVRLLLGFVGVHRWGCNIEPLTDELAARIRVLSERLGMPGFSRVFVSRRAMEVVALGYLRPMVLLPAVIVTQMTPEMLEAVIAHELAHIRRLDLWVNLAQRVVETLLFYHPAVWWLSSRLRGERELCCDELAVQTTGKRLAYATALEHAGRVRLATGQPALATGFGQDRKPTLSRIRHILGLPPIPPDSRAWLAGVIAVALVTVLAMPTISALTAGAESESETRETDRTFALPAPLSEFPRTLNGWTGEDMEIPTTVQEYMRANFADDFITRRYTNAGTRQWADLYVVCCSSRPAGILGHDPRIAFPANGWIGDQTVPSHIVTSSDRMFACVMHRFHHPPTQARMAVLCLYVVDNRIMSEADVALRLARETPHARPQYVAQVQIGSDREESVRSAAGAMADALVDTLAIRGPSVSIINGAEKQPGAEDTNEEGESRQPGLRARTFNSQMTFDVFVQETLPHLPDLDPAIIASGPKKCIGHTPGAAPVAIPAGRTWWVLPSAPVQDWSRLIRELDAAGVPGLMLPMSTDSDMEHLAKLPSLKYLDLISSRITDAGLAPLRNLTQLERLSLPFAKVTDAGVAHLAGMTSLQVLDLSCTQITDVGLAHLKGTAGLWCLSVQGDPITDTGLQNLRGLTKLQFLDLLKTQITDAGLAHLAGLSELQALLLGSPRITGSGLAYLKDLPRLRGLVLVDTQVTDDSLTYLADMTRLQGLALSGPQITDAGIARLQNLAGLQFLELENTQITDTGLASLEGLTQLQWLDLTSDNITDAGLERLKNLAGLKHLNVRGAQVTVAGMQQFKQSLPNLVTY